jgi:hypothetical protein
MCSIKTACVNRSVADTTGCESQSVGARVRLRKASQRAQDFILAVTSWTCEAILSETTEGGSA